MATVTHYTDEQRQNIADQIGAIFGIQNAGYKISREGWNLQAWGDEIQLTVELVATVTKEQAEAILNARPVADTPEITPV